MEDWWEFKLAKELATWNIAGSFTWIWWLRPIWFWIPAFTWVWTQDGLSAYDARLQWLRLPVLLGILGLLLLACNEVLLPHPPCRFQKIQELIPSAQYHCIGNGSLPEAGSLMLGGLLGYVIFSPSLKFKIPTFFIVLICMVLSGLASVVLIQAFVSDVLAGWVLGILLTFVVRKVLFRLR